MLRSASKARPRKFIASSSLSRNGAQKHALSTATIAPHNSFHQSQRPQLVAVFAIGLDSSNGWRCYSTPARKMDQLPTKEKNEPLLNLSSSGPGHTKKPVDSRLTPKKPSGNDNLASSRSTGLAGGTPSSKSASASSKYDETTRSDNILHAGKVGRPHLVQPAIVIDPGVIRTALNDIEEAMSDGTLKPLPAELAKTSKPNPNDPPVPTFAGVELKVDTGKVWWHKFKEMAKFYFFGVVTLGREHRVRAKELSRRLKESEKNGIKGIAEWRDRQFVSTYRKDLLRLVPFISIIIILEEILPLVIIYAPFLLPSTCKLPSQARRIDELADRKRWDALVALGGIMKARNGGTETQQIANILGHEEGAAAGRLDRLPEESIPLLCRVLGIAPYGPSFFLKRRLRSTLVELSEEDEHFKSNKAVSSSTDPISHLSLSELRTILGRRGFPSSPLSLSQLRDNLNWWLRHPEHGTERRLEAVLALARYTPNTPVPPRE